MRTLLTLLLTALTATSGLAGSGSQEEGASLTWTGGHTTGEVYVVIDGGTATPPASSTATPPVSSTATPPVSSTVTPTASSRTTPIGGALPAVLAGAVVAFLLLTLLIAGITVGAVLLGRKVHKKRMLSQRNAPQQKGSITKSSKAGKEEEATEIHTFDVVGDDASIDGRVAMYQELDMRNPDHVSMYTQLRGGTYQELDLKGREEEHHYQRAN